MWATQEDNHIARTAHQPGEEVGAWLGVHGGAPPDIHNAAPGSFLNLAQLLQGRVHLL